MSNLLPASTRKHFNLTTKDTTSDSILQFCREELLIPAGHLTFYDRVPNIDGYYVNVRSGYRFAISGQELAQWEASKKVCVPGRDETIYDQG